MMEECGSKEPEKYLGKEIEEIIIEGGTAIFQEVRILLKCGTHITLNPKLHLSEYSIRPQIIAIRGKWAKINKK